MNVAGGLRIGEPAADLAVASALISSLSGMAISPDTVIFGEISLSGSIRPVSQMEARLKEAEKLGFKRAIVPKAAGRQKPDAGKLQLTEMENLGDLIAYLSTKDLTDGSASKEGTRKG